MCLFLFLDNSHFICATGFACNQRYNNGINNRYLKCSLRSPVLLSDNNRTLTISVDNVELEKFTITGECFDIQLHSM